MLQSLTYTNVTILGGGVSGGGGSSDITQSISSCSKYNGNCSQICTNTTMGSILCSCMIGYKLGADNKTCNGKWLYVCPAFIYILSYGRHQ